MISSTTAIFLFLAFSPIQGSSLYDLVNKKEQEELRSALNEIHLEDAFWNNQVADEVVPKIIAENALGIIQAESARLVQKAEKKSKIPVLPTKSTEFVYEHKNSLKDYSSSLYSREWIQKGDPTGEILWCGPGDKSSDGVRLGTLIGTDSCCRTHDNCDISIKGSHPRKERMNYITGYSEMLYETADSMFTISSCECDTEFYSCLQSVINSPSWTNKDREMAGVFGRSFFSHRTPSCLEFDERRKLYTARDYELPFHPTNPPRGVEPLQFPQTAVNLPPARGIMARKRHERICNNGPSKSGNCCVPLRGEFREIEQHAKYVEGEYAYKQGKMSRPFFNCEQFLGISVCSHPMKNHCDIPAGACGAWVKTHLGEKPQYVVFEMPCKNNNTKSSNAC